MKKLVLWDLDGTLANTSRGVINAVKYAIKKIGLKELPEKDYLRFIGPPNSWSYSNLLGIEGEDLHRAIAFHKEYSLNFGAYEANLYDGIYDDLVGVRDLGAKQAVTTLKIQETTEKMITYLGISDCFDGIYGFGESAKTKAEIIKLAMKCLRQTPDDTVLIGDSVFDLEGAEQTGIDFIAVTYGYGFKCEDSRKLTKSTTGRTSVLGIANHPDDIIPILCGEYNYGE